MAAVFSGEAGFCWAAATACSAAANVNAIKILCMARSSFLRRKVWREYSREWSTIRQKSKKELASLMTHSPAGRRATQEKAKAKNDPSECLAQRPAGGHWAGAALAGTGGTAGRVGT